MLDSCGWKIQKMCCKNKATQETQSRQHLLLNMRLLQVTSAKAYTPHFSSKSQELQTGSRTILLAVNLRRDANFVDF